MLHLLQSLGITHPSLLPLLQSHRPFATPSAASSSGTTKWLGKINTCILAKGNDVERRSACEIASEIVRQDGAGWVLAQWGKGWLGSGLGVLSVRHLASMSMTRADQLVARDCSKRYRPYHGAGTKHCAGCPGLSLLRTRSRQSAYGQALHNIPETARSLSRNRNTRIPCHCMSPSHK